MNRSTISHHKAPSESEHLDIFFENGDSLETYEASFEKFEDFLKQKEILCSKKKPHRKLYLDYQGEISNHRGWLKILWTGFFLNENNLFPNELQIYLLDRETLMVKI